MQFVTDRTDGHSPTADRIRDALRRRFGVDPRALAALRVSLGVLLLVDLGLRARDLVTFYSDAGVLPRTALVRHYPAFSSVSIHATSGEVWVQAVLFLVAAIFATAMLVGYRTRLATLVSLVLLVSLQARNPFVLNAGDILFRRLLFWSIFLPLGTQWAIESRSRHNQRERITSAASAALLVQVVVVYLANVTFKLRTDVWIRGDAIRYVFELDQFTVALAPLVAEYPALLEVGAQGWFVLLCCSPFLLVFTGRARTLLASLFASGHVGMLATMDLGIFPLVSIAALLPFLPPSVWDRLEATVGPALGRVARRVPTVSRRGPSLSFGYKSQTAQSALVTGLVVTILLLNALAIGIVDRPANVPEAAEDRSWNMFSYPPHSEGWYVAHATLESGREATGHVSAARWGGPADGGDRYPRGRWRKFQSKLAASGDDRLLTSLAGDVCRRWSANGEESVRSVTIERVREQSNLSGDDTRESTVVLRHDC